jgi:ATP-dependent Clp endopeptidase proteolytic subunit ClpP
MFGVDYDKNEMMLYDEIGPAYWGLIDESMVIEALAKMEGKHVKVRLNTPGGSVDIGIGIYNALKRHKGGVTTIVDSLAASMGSYLLQAGDTRIVASNAMVMIHDPWTIAFGNSVELRKTAEVLDKYATRMIPDYAARSGKTVEEVTAIMQAETWYAGQEIVEAGWADKVGEEMDADPVLRGAAANFRHPPKELFQRRERIDTAAAIASTGYPNRLAIAAKIAEMGPVL